MFPTPINLQKKESLSHAPGHFPQTHFFLVMNLTSKQCVEFVVHEIIMTFAVTADTALQDTVHLIGAYDAAYNGSAGPLAAPDFLGYSMSIISSQPCHTSFLEAIENKIDIFKHASFDESQAQWDASLDRLAEEHRLLTGNGVFACRRCGSKAVTVKTVQVRSADEGMTEMRTCRDCGKVTRINA